MMVTNKMSYRPIGPNRLIGPIVLFVLLGISLL